MMQQIWNNHYMQICSAVFAVLCNSAVAMLMWLCGSGAGLAMIEWVAGSVVTYMAIENPREDTAA